MLFKVPIPDYIPLPWFLCSDYLWNEMIHQTATLETFQDIVFEIESLDANIWDPEMKRTIIQYLSDDCVVCHRKYNKFWNVYEIREFHKKYSFQECVMEKNTKGKKATVGKDYVDYI